MKHLALRGLSLLAALCAVAHFALAQTSQLTGRITDASSAVVAGASVTAANTETGISRKTASNDEGYYTVASLPPGNYRITVQMDGFKPISQDGVTLVVDQVARIDFTLQVGDVTQVINIEGSAPILEKETSTLGTLVDNKRILELPLLGRNPYSLVNLIPGARAPQSFNALPVDMFTTQFVSINGARGNQNEFLLDGAPNTNPGNAGPTIFPSADSVQEFKVITNNYGAEYGRAAGGVFNVVTKSGTNEFHGSVYEFLRNDALNANEWFANRGRQKKPPFRFNQFGFTFGGPVTVPKLYSGQNRTFFFGNYEGVRQRQAVTFVSTVPTALQRAGDFSQTRNAAGNVITIYNPFTTQTVNGQIVRTAFPNNRIPDNLIDPVAKAMLQFLPLPNTAGNPNTGANNFTLASSQKIDKDLYTVKIDHNLSDRQRISGRYTRDNTPWTRPVVFGNVASPSFGAQVFGRRGFVFDDTYTFSNSLLGSFKYSFNRLTNTRLPLSDGYDLTSLGFPASFANALQFPSIPAISITGFSSSSSVPNVGTAATLGGSDYIRFGLDTHAFVGNLTKTAGRHTLKFGGEYRLMRNNQTQRGDTAINFNFNAGFTQGPNPAAASATAGFPFASFLLGTPASGATIFIPSVAIQSHYYGLFVQDDFKLTPKLTLNLGLRYDYESPRTERYDQLANFDFASAPPLTAAGLNLRGGLSYVGVGGNGRGQWDADRNNVAPRVGFAWSVFDKTVVRGGFGIFFAPNFAGTGTGLTPFGLAGFAATTTFVGSLDGVTPANLLRNPYPQGLRQPSGNRLGLGTLLGENIAFVDRDLATPYSEQWNLNVQQELPAGVALEVAYVGSRGVKLFGDRELNQLPDSALSLGNALREQVPNPFFGQIASGPLAARTVARAQLLRPFPQFLSVNQTNSTWGASTYHSLQVKGERRFARGFTLLASYSFSKLIDDVTGSFAGEAIGGTGFQNWNNLRAERSVSALDVPQRLVVSYIWELPLMKDQKGFLGKVLGGWQTEGILTFSDGNIIGISAANNQTFAQGGGQRPNWSGLSPKLDNPTIDKWFDTTTQADATRPCAPPAVFCQPAPYTFGNAPRTISSLRSHGVKNVDFSALKNTKISERVNTQFRAEFFNLFNTPRFGVPNTSFGSPTFGTVSSTINSARVVQFGLKVIF
jgi:hypothetical protein